MVAAVSRRKPQREIAFFNMRFMFFLSTFESCHRNTDRLLPCGNAAIRSLAAEREMSVLISSVVRIAAGLCGEAPSASLRHA